MRQSKKIKKEFGALLRKERMKKCVGVDEFAVELGISGRTVINWEGGKTFVNLDFVDKIESVLGVYVPTLLDVAVKKTRKNKK
jgi:transcriptional regulator with XRE-family HTH domain